MPSRPSVLNTGFSTFLGFSFSFTYLLQAHAIDMSKASSSFAWGISSRIPLTPSIYISSCLRSLNSWKCAEASRQV